ncbi:ATP-binding protein [Silvimonas sp. JCM 19000]
MKNSLQYRLSLWMATFTVLFALVATLVSYVSLYIEAAQTQDDQLRQISLLAMRYHLPTVDETDLSGRGAEDSESNVVIQHEGETAAADALIKPLSDGMQTAHWHGKHWRVYIESGPDGKRLAVAQQTMVRDEIARFGSMRGLVTLVLMLPLLVGMVVLIIRRTLEPIRQSTDQLDQRDDGNLQPLDEATMVSEIRPFVGAINRLMNRLATALQQQRLFIADAAHELRSPVTALTVQAENLAHSQLPRESAERLAVLQSGLQRTRLLLEQLLGLARLQAAAVGNTVSVSLDEATRRTVEDIMAAALARRVDLGFGRLEAVAVQAIEVDVRTLCRNAIDNAVRYAPEGGVVTVSVYRAEDGAAVFEVEDNGPGIAPEHLQRIFDPFYRVPGNDATGSGLGLTIVRNIAARYGGQITLGPAVTGGLLFRFTQPT